jgi:hypothetical protein
MCPGAEPRWCWDKTEREAGAGPQTSCFGFGLGLGITVGRSLLSRRRGGRRWRGRCRRRQRRARRAPALPLPAGPKRRPVGDTAATVRPPWRLLSATSSAPAQRPKPQRRRTRSTTSPTTSRDEAKWIPDRTNTKRIRLSHNDTDFSPTHGDSAAAYVPVVRSVVIMSGPSHSCIVTRDWPLGLPAGMRTTASHPPSDARRIQATCRARIAGSRRSAEVFTHSGSSSCLR